MSDHNHVCGSCFKRRAVVKLSKYFEYYDVLTKELFKYTRFKYLCHKCDDKLKNTTTWKDSKRLEIY